MEHESDGDTNCNLRTGNNPQRIGAETERLGNIETSIVEIGQNIGKSPGDLRRLAVTQTPVRNYQFTLM